MSAGQENPLARVLRGNDVGLNQVGYREGSIITLKQRIINRKSELQSQLISLDKCIAMLDLNPDAEELIRFIFMNIDRGDLNGRSRPEPSGDEYLASRHSPF